MIGLLPESFQLEAGQSLLIRLSPDFNDSEEYIGISGFAYSPSTGGVSINPYNAATWHWVALDTSAHAGKEAHLVLDDNDPTGNRWIGTLPIIKVLD